MPPVAARGQCGLLDVALDPQFAENRRVYWTYAEPGEEEPEAESPLRESAASGLATARAIISRLLPLSFAEAGRGCCEE